MHNIVQKYEFMSYDLTLEVQMTSLKLIFIQLSQLTKCPL